MIHIVTCWTRTPEVLDKIYQSLQFLQSFNTPYHWYIVTTNSDLDIVKFKNTTKLIKPISMPMHTGVNYYYDSVPDKGQWVYVLDDDNLIHPSFSFLYNYIQNPIYDMIAVGQQLNENDNRFILTLSDINIQKIDNGQFLLRRQAVGDLRYWPIYRGDGYFATEMKILITERNKEIGLLPIVATYYNAQHWLKS
jgi:hypothetical protein